MLHLTKVELCEKCPNTECRTFRSQSDERKNMKKVYITLAIRFCDQGIKFISQA